MRILEEDALTIRYNADRTIRTIMSAQLVQYENGELGFNNLCLLRLIREDVPESEVTFWPEIPANAPRMPICYRNDRWYMFEVERGGWRSMEPSLEELLL